MKRYNIINNTLGWLAFAIAAVTYLLTVEPTASFWDCPEFIVQGFKLEVGHPPGNPIFMLTARFFVTLFGGEAQSAALAVNCMSALLSAGTILLLFWSVTHLARKLVMRGDDRAPGARQTLLIMAAGMCGALVYTWSPTFWFSAVEGEVYAFSSFCTALVFWLILKWENRVDEPHSDRYLVLIAYVIGVSIAVHLLNLLCIPAIVLIFYYRKFANPNVKGSLLALVVSAVIVFFILYGLVPGFISVAQRFELLFVNVFGCSYNSGVLFYAILTVAIFVWTIWELYRQRSAWRIKLGVFLSIIFSGMPFIGHSWLIPTLLITALLVYLLFFCSKVPVRIFNVLVLSIMVIFIGYSSYALLLIRSSADTPMNQNSPDNVFALASYLNREQYGDRPLFFGQTVAEELDLVNLAGNNDPQYNGVEVDAAGYPRTKPVRGVYYEKGAPVDLSEKGYTKVVKTSPDEPDRYVREVNSPKYLYSPSLTTLMPRMYSSDEKHVRNYKSWAEYTNPDFENIPAAKRAEWARQGYVLESDLRPYLDGMTEIDMGTYGDGTAYTTQGWKMGFWPNFRYFMNYQLNHMYWRYFMWNFAGQQNDLQGNGEPHLGNWISGIPVLDELRLGDQSALPDEFGKGNPGHNVFYMLPLLLGVIGLLWQAMRRGRGEGQEELGIRQFWVVFFLFFMTGIAIVLYLNQTPGQPRERDYAFAGSFYAFSIWVGLGVPAIAAILRWLYEAVTGARRKKLPPEVNGNSVAKWAFAGIATAIGIAVPLQMVSQTWDDHDRSGRYTTRDFGANYLNSLDDNAIIFTNGDNDTFPLWYAQEVEGVRPDVKVVNLMYLSTDWYANQMRKQSYTAEPIPMYAKPEDYAYMSFWMSRMADPGDTLNEPVAASRALPDFYAGTSPSLKRMVAKYNLSADESRNILADPEIYAPLDSARVYEVFGRYPADTMMNLAVDRLPRQAGLNTMLTFDIVANSVTDGFKRPVYFATTVPESLYLGFRPYMHITGMARQVTPFAGEDSPVAAKAYRNIMERFRWGGLDGDRKLYLDETVRRMVSSTRLAVLDVVRDLMYHPSAPASDWARENARANGRPEPATQADMARELLQYVDAKMPQSQAPYEMMLDLSIAEMYADLWAQTGSAEDLKQARRFTDMAIARYSQLVRYASTLTPSQRGRMGSDRSALRYLGLAVGFANYLDLRQAMLKAGAPEEDITDLDYTFGINEGFDTYDLLYVNNLTDEQIEDLYEAGYHPQTIAALTFLRDAHARYAVNPNKISTKVAADMGMTIPEWRAASR